MCLDGKYFATYFVQNFCFPKVKWLPTKGQQIIFQETWNHISQQSDRYPLSTNPTNWSKTLKQLKCLNIEYLFEYV